MSSHTNNTDALPDVAQQGQPREFMGERDFKAHVIDRLGELREAMSEVSTPASISQAVEDGMRRALVNPDTWAEAMRGIQKAAQQEAGGWLLGGIKSFFSRLAWVVVIGLGVYMLGGWTALAALLKSGGTGHG